MRFWVFLIALNSAAVVMASARTPGFYVDTKYQIPITCGAGVWKTVLEYHVVYDSRYFNATRFAIVLGGSPQTQFFSEDPAADFKGVVSDLLSKGYRVFEAKFPQSGFYGLCMGEGIEGLRSISNELYDIAVKALGYTHQPQERLVGLGFSLGAIQLQMMAFTSGKYFDKLALTGVLWGNVQKGCVEANKTMTEYDRLMKEISAKHAALQDKEIQYIAKIKKLQETFWKRADLLNGWSWAPFLHYLTTLVPSPSEDYPLCDTTVFTKKWNFDKQPYYKASDLALFEGNLHNGKDSNANEEQAHYITRKRHKAGAKIEERIYEGCGHDVLACTKRARPDIIRFLTN